MHATAMRGGSCAVARGGAATPLSSRVSSARGAAVARRSRRVRAPRRAAAAPPRAERKPEVFPAEWATKPVVTLREEVQGRVERSPAPLWATFAGAAGGAWSGGVIAASPFTGAVEALALDAANKPTVVDAWTRRVSSRVSVGGEGALHETLWWRLAEGDAAASPQAVPPAAFERLSGGAFADQREGFAFWEDGSFSDGPLSLRDAAQRAAVANPGCVEIEQCICIGGRRRARVTHTIALRKAAEVAAEQWGLSAEELAELGDDGDDLLLQQLRVRAVVEAWDGPPPAAQAGGDADEAAPPAGSAPPPPPLSTQPRPAPRSAAGSWLAFVRAAAPLAPEAEALPPAAALPGAPPPPPPARFAHEAYEVLCNCAVPTGRPYPPPGYDEDDDVADDEDDGDDDFDEDADSDSEDSDDQSGDIVVRGIPRAAGGDGREPGGSDEEGSGEDVGSAVWLPGGVVASCALGTGPGGDGVTLRAGWAQPRGGLVYVEREYDGEGRLVEVRHVTMGRPGADGRAGGA